MTDTLKLVSTEARKQKWIIIGLAAVAFLLFYGQQNPGQSFLGIPNEAWIIILIAVAAYYLRKRVGATIVSGEQARDRVLLLEQKEFATHGWDMTDPTILTWGNMFLLQGDGTPTWVLDAAGNLLARSPQNILQVRADLESSEIVRKAQLGNIETSRIKEALRQKGIEIENEEN